MMKCLIKKSQILFRLRWDHSDCKSYYDYTFNYSQDLFYQCSMLLSEISTFVNYKMKCEYFNDCEINSLLNLYRENVTCLYEKLVELLNTASELFIKKLKVNFFKYWWDHEGDLLKNESIVTHKNWCSTGRPMHGVIYEAKRKAKAAYKLYLKRNMLKDKEEISNALHESLLNKNNDQFWKTWKYKFGSNSKKKSSINGLRDENAIANAFSEHFAKTSNKKKNSKLNDSLDLYSSYKGDITEIDHFDIESISNIILQLEKGKSVGHDNLAAEHFQNCHPCIIVIISNLFKSCGLLGFVPELFGKGIIIPIPKLNDANLNNVEDFRGITISPVLSKIFESCIMSEINSYLTTSNRQFGFKKGVGCSDVLFTLNSVTNHYVTNNSTVNLCALDLSKGFDRVDHNYYLIS